MILSFHESPDKSQISYFLLCNYIDLFIPVAMSGAIGGFAQSADRAARFADPHIAQLICRSRSYRKIAQA